MTKISFNNSILYITFDNPPNNTLLSPDFIDLNNFKEQLFVNEVKAIIISGIGRHFSQGADVEIIKNTLSEDLKNSLNKGKEILRFIYDLDIPVIAAIEGVCFGGGLEIALAAHIRVVSEKSLMAFPETMHNLMPGLGGSILLKRFLSLGRSIEMLLGCNMYDAEKAKEMGLVDYVVSSKKSLTYAEQLAYNLTHKHSINLINKVMKALKNAYELTVDEAMDMETEMFCALAKALNDK